MLFKNNIDSTEEDKLLLRALIQSGSINVLYKQLPEFEDDLSLSLNSLSNKLNKENELEDLLYEIINLKKIRLKKIEAVNNQKYEEAANLRDKEKQSEKKINIDFYRKPLFKEINSDIDRLKEYYMYKDSVISEESSINLLIQPGTATKEDIGNLLSELSKLYRMLGGSGINFKLEGISNPKYRFDYE